jgi:integrase
VLTVPEFEWVVDLLKFWIHEGGRDRFPAADRSTALWPSERADRITLGSLGASFAAARDAVGLPKVLGLHCLRHSYITHLIEAGYDPAFVQILLSPQMGVHDVQHEPFTGADLRGGGGYLPPSITRIPRRFDACSAGPDARLVA